MSFNVLVIPEDFRKDEHLLRPILRKMVTGLRSRARVDICWDPRLRGVAEALHWERIEGILHRYQGMYHCFLLIVDRDGNAHRRKRLDRLEGLARELLSADRLFAENAWQEVEVWALAGMTDLPPEWAWTEVRRHPDAKETYFDDYVRRRELSRAPYGGRQALGREAARNYARIRQLCPEDVGNLERRLKEAFVR